MNKKVMALAVAGAFAAPGAAMAQASNVQIYGTVYMEYSYGKQGLGPAGQLVNGDTLQTPGSEIGFKGEEALGGGLTAWFQCASTAEYRGNGTQNGVTAAAAGAGGTQTSGAFCGRNSAIGMKGSFGNLFVGNWDAPMKANSGAVRIVSETGAWGTQMLLMGASSSYMDNATGVAFSRRVNNSLNYASPTWAGFQVQGIVSTTSALTGTGLNTTTAAPLGKSRLWGLGANYTNGPLLLSANYERHNNFNTFGTGLASTDSGWYVGGTYEFGPVKLGVMYAKQNFDGGGAGAATGDGSVAAWNLALDWKIAGPHELLVGYAKANSTTGAFGANTLAGSTFGVRTFNQGAGQTGASEWTIEYQYWFSKRTRGSLGYAQVTNDNFARYNLGGYVQPAAGQNQNAFITSIKTTF